MRIFLIFLFVTFSFFPAWAVPRIDITKGNTDPISIAMNDFGGEDEFTEVLGKSISKVITSDLERSGLFKSIDKNAFIEKLKNSNKIPEFASWRQINATAVVAGNVATTITGNIKVEFRVWDNFNEQQIAGAVFITTRSKWRRIAHKVADEIYKSLVGEDGYFDTRIAFIDESGDAFNKIKRLALMDQDGSNLVYLTSGKELVLTPRFSPDTSKILYLSYETRIPKVFMIDIVTKRKRLIGHFPGMSFAPRFSPDGKNAVMSVAKNGNTDIYSIDLTTLIQKRLTNGAYIDTSPCYSPDNQQIVFSSDRSGKGQIYIMNKDGSNQHRISFGKGGYHTPVWSPRGDFIAFTKIYQGSFHIGVMRVDGTGERILTHGYMVEGPNWAPNGRVIIFSRQEKHTKTNIGKTKLQSIDLTGYYLRDLATPNEASDPFWSPLLH